MPLKKKQLVCPNPLFLMWLEEWRKEAEERDLNSKWTYGKAIASLKKYPLPLRSGKEAKILENVGDGIAKKLDERLQQYLDDGGDPVYLHKIDPVLEVKNNIKENTKQYVCKYRSGPYALILTLYKESQDPSYIGFMTKIELQKKAQPLCDKSFTLPDPGSQYTAWSSMSTLTKKGYITRRSNPAQYAITDSGCELALRLLEGTHQLSDNTMKHIRKSQSPLKSMSNEKLPDIKNDTSSSCGVNNLLADIRKHNYQSIKSPNKSKTSSSTITKSTSNRKDVTNKSLPCSMDVDDIVEVSKPLPSKGSKKDNVQSFVKRLSCEISIDESETDQLFNMAKKASIASSPSGTSNSSSQELSYWYVTDNGSVTVLKSKALVSIDETLGLGFLIKTRMYDLKKSDKKYKLDESRKPVDDFVFAYIADTDSDEIASPPKFDTPSKSSHSSASAKSSKSHSELNEDDDDSLLLPDLDEILEKNSNATKRKNKDVSISDKVNSLGDGTKQIRTEKYSSSHTKINHISNKKDLTANAKKNNVANIPIDIDNAYSSSSKTITSNRRPKSVLTNHNTESITITETTELSTISAKRPSSIIDIDDGKAKVTKPNSSTGIDMIMESGDTNILELEPQFILMPGSFDILLCVDVIETSGAGKRKKELADKLMSSSINVNIRKLQLGDFLWVAKEKNGSKRELVLDFIVERKRMDDLASSIVDGRFREQKFRLKSSGLLKPIYLVEKYGSVEHYPVPVTTLQQAITNTQVIDGLFVKETMDIYDSVNYLSLVTAQLCSLYSNKTLYALNMEAVRSYKMGKIHEELLAKDIQYFSTFEEFSLETNKNKMLTVCELFAKQLMMIKGVSTERALAIIDKYPTPCSLVNAYDSLSLQSEKENLLTDIPFGKNKRKLGAPLSIQVYLMYSKLNAS